MIMEGINTQSQILTLKWHLLWGWRRPLTMQLTLKPALFLEAVLIPVAGFLKCERPCHLVSHLNFLVILGGLNFSLIL